MARTGFPAEAITEKHREAVLRSRQLLENGQTFRKEREGVWRQSLKQYEGKHWSTTEMEDPTADLITVNVSFATVNTIIPYVTSEEPRFLVSPYSADATPKNARLQQAMLNRQWRQIDGQAALRVAAEDYLVYGDGYVKASWTILDKILDDTSVAEVAELYVDAISPWDVWIDPFATSVADARWVCQRLYKTRRELEADDRFSEAALDELPWGRWERDADEGNEDRPTSEDEDWVAIYEFYDKLDRALYVFTTSGPLDPLRVVEEADCPIIQLPNYRLPHSPYHMGELEQLWPMQQELNKTRSQLITHRRRNVGKYLYRDGALDEDGIAALASPIINEAIKVLGDMPLDNVIQPAKQTQLSADAYSSADQTMRDIYEISGVNEYLRGATPEIRRTATEASIIEGASNVKTRAKLADVERTAREVGEWMLAIAKEVFPDTDVDEMAMYLTGPEAEQLARMDAAEEADILSEGGAPPSEVSEVLASAQGADVTVTPNADIFVGVYAVEVESGSTEMRNPIFKEQKFRELAVSLIEMAPVLAQSGVQINLRKVLELWFEAAGIADVDGMFDAAGAALGGIPGLGAPPGALGDPGVPQGQPNIQAVQPPLDGLTAENTGAIPQAE